ncbi:MAG TPA: hypothetical protein VJT81_08730 [Burkholderiales bacterium]|nr:hypothetical protein [Burkholderiales bacterium]
MRSRTVSDAFEQEAIRSAGEIEELRPATYRETAAAIFMALAESGLDEGPWSCEIQLLEEYCDVEEQVPDVIVPTQH